MAYLQELRVDCQYPGRCEKQAVVMAWDNRNERAGLYCRKHGQERLEVLKREEN